jgi:hypothetical protein
LPISSSVSFSSFPVVWANIYFRPQKTSSRQSHKRFWMLWTEMRCQVGEHTSTSSRRIRSQSGYWRAGKIRGIERSIWDWAAGVEKARSV